MPEEPSVSIVIPAYNEERFIGRCLESCINQTSAPDEIIVVNNRSTDNTVSIARRYREQNPHIDIRILDQNDYQGIVPTRNHGYNNARSDIIGRTDADAIPAHNWIEAIRRRFKDPDVDAATGPCTYDMPMRGVILSLDRMLRERHCNEKNERFLLGLNMAIRTRAWEAVRHLTQLDLENELHEDIDLALTLFENGFEIVFEPSMVVTTSGRRVDSSLPDFYNYVRRYPRTTELHGIKSRTARTTVITLMLLYYPSRTMRFFYDVDNSEFTSEKLREELRKRTSLLRRRNRTDELATARMLTGP